MTARKKSGRRKKTTTRKSPRKKPASRKAAAARTRKPRAASLADRLSELVEHAAAGALRRVVDSGGRGVVAWLPDAPELRREAGAYLQELRELAGLTREELAEAADLRDRSIIEALEAGTTTASVELILRLAAILSRHDPVPFVSQMLRNTNPVLWALLEDWGIGRLPLQLTREREFVNVLRGHDEARDLSDEDFAQVLAFTRAAFEMGLHFAVGRGASRRGKRSAASHDS